MRQGGGVPYPMPNVSFNQETNKIFLVGLEWGWGRYITQGHSDPKSNLQLWGGGAWRDNWSAMHLSHLWCMTSVTLIERL